MSIEILESCIPFNFSH